MGLTGRPLKKPLAFFGDGTGLSIDVGESTRLGVCCAWYLDDNPDV